MYIFGLLMFSGVLLMIEGKLTTNAVGPKPLWNATFTDILKRDLLLNYDKYARPAQHYNTTTVRLGLTARHFDINEMKSSFTLHCYVQLVWTDEKLEWNSSDYGNISVIRLAEHEIWQPDLFVYNSATAQPINLYGNIPILAYDNGEVLWVPPGQFTVLCDINLKYWPFDTQTCRLTFGSWAHDGSKINLTKYSSSNVIEDEHLIDSHEWKLVSTIVTREVKTYECCADEFFPFIHFNITLQRVSPSYKAVVVSPAFAIILLILMTFWLPPQAGEKIIIQGFTAVIIVMYLLYFTQKLPAMGSNTPLIVLFYSHALYMICFAMITSIIVIWLARKRHTHKLPWKLKDVLIRTFGNDWCLGQYTVQKNINPQNNAEDQHIMDDDNSVIDTNKSQDCQQEWILLAAVLDRIAFYFFLVLFAILSVSYSL